MLVINFIFLTTSLSAIYCIIYLFLIKYNAFYVNNCNFYANFILNKNHNFVYKKLNKRKVLPETKLLFSTNNSLFCAKTIYENKNYLLTISKLVDYKIEKINQTFKARGNSVFIDSLTQYVLDINLPNNKTQIFNTYKLLYKKLNVKQKENKIFKILLARRLIEKIIFIKNDLDEIFYILNKSKTITKLKNYENTIFYYAQIYGVCKYNNLKNSLINTSQSETNYMINKLIAYLYDKQKKLNFLLTYLKVIFN